MSLWRLWPGVLHRWMVRGPKVVPSLYRPSNPIDQVAAGPEESGVGSSFDITSGGPMID